MKIKILYIGLSVFLLSWIIPSLVQLTMDSTPRYPFTYYSSVINQFCYFTPDDDNIRGKDTQGNVYTEAEFTRVLPMFYSRQLAMENALPDSIQGIPVDLHTITRNKFFFRYRPKDKNTPVIALYPMFESCSGKVDLENPSDMFRLKENIEFIDMASNQINEKKSTKFQQALENAGFSFPAQWVAGIPSNRKSYDEGYFALDQQNNLFHIKMTNGKPFVKDTKVGHAISVSRMFPMECENRSLYGFLFDTNNTLYYLSTNDYQLVKVLEDVNPDKDKISIMANMFYWTVAQQTATGEYIYALENKTMHQVDSLFRPAPKSTWDKALPYLFPFTINFQDYTNSYIYPRISGYYFYSLSLNLILTIIIFALYHKKKSHNACLAGFITLFTGIAGFITMCFLVRIKQ